MKKDDFLSRQPFIDLLKNIIVNQSETKSGYSIAIDGEWGSGKTWILNELEKQLEKDYLIFHYNAWQNDYYEEPLTAILSILISSLKKIKKLNEKNGTSKVISKSITTLLKITGTVVEKKWGINPSDAFEAAKDATSAISGKKLSKEDFNTLLPLENALEQIQKVLITLSESYKIVFVVDELDRCLPEYAIKVLERLHHVCNEIPVFQIIAINKKDLSFGICKVFGMNNTEYDRERFADKYLQKFIQLIIPLNNGQISNEENILSGIDEGFVPAIAINKNYLIQFYQQLMRGIPPRTQEYIKQQVILIHKLTVLSGHTLEYYSYGLLCCELMYCIMKLIFKKDPSYKLQIENNQLIVKSGLSIFSDKCLIISCSQFDANLEKLFRTSTEYYSDGRINNVNAVPCKNGQCQMLNYFVENYNIRDKWPEAIRSDGVFIPEREFLGYFKETLKNF